MKVKSLATALVLHLLILTAVQAQERVAGNGHVKKQTRSVKGDMREIHLSGKFTLYVTQGNTPSLEVEAEDNMLPYIETEADGNELSIRVKKSYNLSPSKEMIIRITTGKLREIHSSGQSIINSNGTLKGESLELSLSGKTVVDMDIQYNKLELAISGNSRVKMKGGANKSEFAISGDGEIAASDLKGEDVEIAISGKGAAYVYASRKLEIAISGKGTVKYKGNPAELDHSISGKGIIEKM